MKLGLTGLALVLSAGTAFGALPCRYLHEMTGEVVTPHHSFRGSDAEEPIRTLFLLDRHGARDAVEVVERFAVAPTYFLMVSGPHIAEEDMYESSWTGTTVYEKTRELDRKLGEGHRLYVFGRKAFTSVGEEHRYRILKAVRDEGAGLLLVMDTGVPAMPYGKVYAEKLPTPSFALRFPGEYKSQLNAWRLGRGRVVELSWKGPLATYFSLTPKFPVDDLWPAKYENALAFVGQAMRFAAGRDETPSAPSRVRFRDRFNAEVSDTTCAGRYFKDTVGANGAVAVEPLDVPSPVGGLSVDAPETVGPEAAYGVRAVWKTPCARIASATVETIDSPYGRVMTRRTLPVGAGATSVDVRIGDARVTTKAGYVRVTLRDADGRALDLAEAVQFFPSRIAPDYRQMGWETAIAMHPFAGARILVDRLGFECGLTHPTPGAANVREVALLNQSVVPYMTRIGISAAANGSSESVQLRSFLDGEGRAKFDAIKGDKCFYRPEVRELWREMIRYRGQNLVKYGPPFYSLGDENHMDPDCGFGEYDDRYFREFLRTKYVTVGNLNRAWRTNCTDFASVPHLRPQEAKALGNLAAWGDHRAYVEKMYADIHRLCREEIRAFDPGALVGAEGSVPGNLEETIADLEFWGPYSDPVEDEVLRSLGGDRIRMLWWGGYPSSHGGRGSSPYPVSLMQNLAKGTVNGSAWFDVSLGQNHGFFYSDLKVADDVAAYLPWHDRFKDGLAQLLIRNPLKDEGVLLYWSHASRLAALASEKCLAPTDGLMTLIRFASRNGRSFEFVSARTLDRLARAKTVFLCGATALSDAEVAALRDFAAKGGRLVADAMPATMDENLCWRERSPLADLFGRNGSVLVGRRFSSWQAQEKSFARFDRAVSAFLPPPAVCVPETALDENAILNTRCGPGFDLVTAMWPVKDLGGRALVRLPARRFVYSPTEGFVSETDRLELDFGRVPFVCRAVFERKQEPPAFGIEDTAAGGEVTFTTPALQSGRVYNLTVRDAEGNVRWNLVFDRAANRPRRLFVGLNERPGTWRATLTDCATGLRTERMFAVTP